MYLNNSTNKTKFNINIKFHRCMYMNKHLLNIFISKYVLFYFIVNPKEKGKPLNSAY